MTINEYETRIGALLVKAQAAGGESLLDTAMAALGVALRHLHRVQEGQLTLVPGVVAEIEASFARAEQHIAAEDTDGGGA